MKFLLYAYLGVAAVSFASIAYVTGGKTLSLEAARQSLLWPINLATAAKFAHDLQADVTQPSSGTPSLPTDYSTPSTWKPSIAF